MLGKNWIQQRTIDEESRVLKDVVDFTSELDLFILDELESETTNHSSIFEKVLRTLPKLIKDAEILDVRLLDSKKNELYFAATFGDEWNSGSNEEIKRRKEKTFPVQGEKPLSIGAQVYKSGETQILNVISKEDAYNETFANVKKIIVSPLLMGGKVFGVLDIRSTSEKKFPITTQPIVELMSRQLALFFNLVTTIQELRNIQVQQIQTFQDFIHQLRGPIYQATARSRIAINSAKKSKIDIPFIVTKNLYATAGLANKANRVAKNIHLFSDLAKNLPLRVNLSPIIFNQFIKLLIETAADNSIMINPDRNIKIEIEEIGFTILKNLVVKIDSDMLEQALNNLLDNATKYSFPNSIITISGNYQVKKRKFQIIVKNKGIPINSNEVKLCLTRGWRGEFAKISTGEGGGIGLWVVDNIMNSHNGILHVSATDSEGYTQVKLIFPVNKS